MGAAHCTFQNDTPYPVMIVDYDGTRTLNPGESQGNYLISGPYSVDLILKLSDAMEVKKNFPRSEFQNRSHKISTIFSDYIDLVQVLRVSAKWVLIYNHPGGNCEEKIEIQTVTKNSWTTTAEKGTEFEAKVGAKIKAVEMSASFRHYTKLSHVDAFEHEIKETRQLTFKGRCYLWQEIVVIETDQPPPFKFLEIPTPHVEQTTTPDEPNVKFIHIK